MRTRVLSAVFLLIVCGSIAPAEAGEQAASPESACAVAAVAEVVVAPTQPEIALRIRVFRVIWVDVEIDPEGKVSGTATRLDNKSELDVLDLGKLSEAAARQWRFNTAPGCKVRYATLTFDFQHPVPIGQPGGTVFRSPYTVEMFRPDIRFDVNPTFN